MKIEEQMTLYPELSGEEREAVEEYVDAHPEWKPALDEAKRWDRLLRDARRLGQDPTEDEALAYYVVTRRLQLERAPEAVKDLIRRVEERIEDDPILGHRVAEMESRLHSTEQGSPASERFERLMMRRREVVEGIAGASSSHSAHPRPGSRASTMPITRHAGVRNGQSSGRPGFAVRARQLVSAVIAAVAIYAVLYAAGQLTRAPHERLADFDGKELALDGFESVRGGASADAPTAAIVYYLDALAQLRGAERSFVGLFPHFDEARLDSAAALLHEVTRLEPAESFLVGEAAFMLGKTQLARGDIAAAEQAFSRVVANAGRRAPEARRILAEIRT